MKTIFAIDAICEVLSRNSDVEIAVDFEHQLRQMNISINKPSDLDLHETIKQVADVCRSIAISVDAGYYVVIHDVINDKMLRLT